MDHSQQESRGRPSEVPTAAQTQAFADTQTILAGMKRASNEVSDLELPEGSRPMLGSDRTSHRPNHPEIGPQQQPSSNPSNSSSPSTINALGSPVPQQQDDPTFAPLAISSPAVDFSAPRTVMDSGIPEPSSAAIITPASSHSRPLDSEIAPISAITSLSVLDRRSPAVQSMLREAFNEGRAEGKREFEVKLDEAEAKVEELRKKLDPSKMKAAYDRGWREGGIAG